MVCKLFCIIYVTAISMLSPASSTIHQCSIVPKESIIGTEYYYIALYPFAFNEKVQEVRNVSPIPTKRMGLLEYFVCNDIKILQEIVLTLLLDKKFILTNEESNIYIIISHLPLNLTLQVASMVLPFQLTVQLMHKGKVWIDPKRYPNVNQRFVNTFGEQVLSIIKAFNLNNIAFIALTHNERDTAYKNIWNDLLEEDLELCVERFNVNYTDTGRMEKIIKAIKSNREQKIIFCYTSTGENSDVFFQLVNISHQLKLSERNWIWNKYSPSFVTHYNATVGASDGSIILSTGIDFGYNISNTKFILDIAYELTMNTNRLLRLFPIFVIKYLLKGKTDRNCFYTNSSSGKSNEVEINKGLYRTCEEFHASNYPLKVHWGSHGYKSPVTRCQKRHCPAGYRQILAVISDNKTYGRKYWECVPCEKGSIKRKSGTGECTICTGLLVSNIERTQCYDPYYNVCISYNSTRGLIVIAFSGTGSVLSIIVLATFLKYRKTPIIKSANVRLSVIQQGCHLILFLATPFMFIGKPALIKCQTRHVIVGLLLTIICSIIFIKTQNLMFIFNAQLRVSKQERYFATLVDMFWALLFFSVQVITAIFMISHTPAKVLESLDSKNLVRYIYCNTGGHLNVQFFCCVIIMLIVVVQGLRAWKLPSYFNNTKYITVANLLSVLMLACMVPLYYSAANAITQVFLQVMLILMCNVTLLTVIYGNKIYTVWFKSDKNTSAAFRTKMQEHVREKINSSMSGR